MPPVNYKLQNRAQSESKLKHTAEKYSLVISSNTEYDYRTKTGYTVQLNNAISCNQSPEKVSTCTYQWPSSSENLKSSSSVAGSRHVGDGEKGLTLVLRVARGPVTPLEDTSTGLVLFIGNAPTRTVCGVGPPIESLLVGGVALTG